MLPAADGTIALGATYNSLLVGSGVSVGAFGPGWRARTGVDVKLIEASDGSVTYVSQDGVTGAYTKSGTIYVAPGEFKAGLVKTDGSGGVGWRITEHESGRQLLFTPGGRLKSIKDRNANETQFLDPAGDPTKITSTRGTDGARRAAILTNTSDRITSYQQIGDLGIGTRTATYAYAGTGAASVLSKITQPSGRTVEFGYDGTGNVTTVTLKNAAATAAGRTLIGYDGSHRVTSVKRVLTLATNDGATTRFAYPSATQTQVAGPTTDQALPVGSVPRTTYTVNSTTKRTSAATDPLGDLHGLQRRGLGHRRRRHQLLRTLRRRERRRVADEHVRADRLRDLDLVRQRQHGGQPDRGLPARPGAPTPRGTPPPSPTTAPATWRRRRTRSPRPRR